MVLSFSWDFQFISSFDLHSSPTQEAQSLKFFFIMSKVYFRLQVTCLFRDILFSSLFLSMEKVSAFLPAIQLDFQWKSCNGWINFMFIGFKVFFLLIRAFSFAYFQLSHLSTLLSDSCNKWWFHDVKTSFFLLTTRFNSFPMSRN